MKKPAVDPHLLQLLVSIYNESIQTFYHFPEVILCGSHHLEAADLALLLAQGFVVSSGYDSFGKNYRLSRKGEAFLFHALFPRRAKPVRHHPASQYRFPFVS
ncbi:hypothetical protein [Flavisolibacter nicotianae]|uniref:hypothetical protein n=1 Tax=Flavisolibacter nicotianae TaxID=2364882 RepID=UPI000EAFDE27|nr:hypothetical protein [Flavisolibacter nicotianae]